MEKTNVGADVLSIEEYEKRRDALNMKMRIAWRNKVDKSTGHGELLNEFTKGEILLIVRDSNIRYPNHTHWVEFEDGSRL